MKPPPYTVIKSQKQYEAYCALVEELANAPRKTRAHQDTMELLRLLITTWHAEREKDSDADPVKMLGNLMKRNRISVAKLAEDLQISKTLVYDIVNYRRRMSREVIRKMASRFKVSQELFNRPYNLITPKPAQVQKQPPRKREHKDVAIIEFLKARTGKPAIAKMKDGSLLTIWNISHAYMMGDEYAQITTNISPRITGAEVRFILTSDIAEFVEPDGATLPRTLFVSKPDSRSDI